MSRKPRADSPLMTLPEEQRLAIYDYSLAHTLDAALDWLAAELPEVSTSRSALGRFLSWQRLQLLLQGMRQTAADVAAELSKAGLPINSEQVRATSQAVFTAQALQLEEPKLWLEIEKLELKKREMDLVERRIKLLEQRAAQADQAEAITGNQELTPEEKDRRLRNLWGMG